MVSTIRPCQHPVSCPLFFSAKEKPKWQEKACLSILRVLDSPRLTQKTSSLRAPFAAVCFAVLPPPPVFSGTLHVDQKKAQMLGCKISTGLWLQGDTSGMGDEICCALLLVTAELRESYCSEAYISDPVFCGNLINTGEGFR